jgi:hypothetical protein
MKSFLLSVAALAFCLSVAAAQGPAPTEPIDGFRDTPLIPGSPWHIHDPDRPQPPVVTPGATFSQKAPAPSDADVLFAGDDLSKWQDDHGGAATWTIRDGYVETRRGGSIRTRGTWGDFQLHVEFATPNPPHGSGQARGNSGILINGMYEVQVLDSYHAKTYPDGQCGAIYGQSPPLVNASKAPGEWQTYDIIFESPRWSSQGELIKKAVVTVIHNGIVVQNRRELIGGTDGISREIPWKSPAKYTRHAPRVFIALQDHNNPVRYRNIWIRPLDGSGAKGE